MREAGCPGLAPQDPGKSPFGRSYTDAEFRDLARLLEKVSNPGARWFNEPTAHPVHRHRTSRATGAAGGPKLHVSIYLRQNLRDDQHFSCGIVFLAPSGLRLTLARYNGSNRHHGGIRYRPHIYRATEGAILAGKRPEYEAEETARYETLEGALACLIEDFRLSGIRAKHDLPSLFDGYQS